ncbi:MAG: FecR domain-containing protein, partial [Tannerella sp.]|nr:FecR domain-containing protein [Tannerella sp.]
MHQWQSLLERFLRHECSGRENKIVYHALRDGLIDDEFRAAIDTIMNDPDTMADINSMKPLPEDILENIRSRMKKRKVNFIGQRSLIREWLKIAVAVAVTLFVSWQIFYMQRQEEPPTAMNTITVPAGQTVALTLADGTNIWLNARTMMKYPSVFTGNRREIILEGEGFFDVAHDPEKLFI